MALFFSVLAEWLVMVGAGISVALLLNQGSSSKPSVAKPYETKMFRSDFPYSLKKCCFFALEIV